MKTITFGNIIVNANCLLAPLAGISDLPYRRLNRRFGCRYAFTEMVSARAVLARSKIDMKMLLTEPQDRPLGVQLVGKDAEVLRRALDIIREYRFDSIDFNAACPVKKVTRRGEGACLMKEPRKLRELLKVLVVESGVPVTVKIRAGWDRRSINAREAALYARDAGVAAVFIHGRTRSQLYKETVDYGVIRQVKEALDIPVIGSGDVFSPVLAKKMLDETGCDGVLVARGGLGNPWIFNEIESYLADGSLPERPAIDELVDTMLEHYRACCEFHGETIGTMIFRKFFAWYTKGFAHIRPIRMRAFQATQQAGMEAVVNELRSMRRDTGLNIQKRGSQ